MSRARTSRTRGVMGRMYGRASRTNPASAIERYEIFHKKEPRAVVVIRALPTRFREIGDAISVMYETDKWNDDGDDIRYKHLHGPGVRTFEVAERDDDAVALPVTPPSASEGFARLGRCLGFFVKSDGRVREYNVAGSDLFASPSGNLLGVYSPSRGWVAFMAGGSLRVESEGIDG